jgi:putative DNA primase/helicase
LYTTSFQTERAHSPETIARALGGTRQGAGWTARCPAHDDRAPSLSVSAADNGKILVHCHAGCEQRQVVAALKARGLWAEPPRTFCPPSPFKVRQFAEPDQGERHKGALAIWGAARPAAGTLVETYLAARGIRSPETKALRFHAGLKHPSGGVWPAMVALVTDGADGLPVAIHRTFLARDGLGKAPIDPTKMMLGPCRGGAVRLAEPSEVLMIGEGIETCLAAMQATGRAAWAALSTSGLRSLSLPKDVRDVIVLADGDEAGETAARNCALRWKREGRRVRIARPPKGLDFNDMLLARATPIAEAVR